MRSRSPIALLLAFGLAATLLSAAPVSPAAAEPDPGARWDSTPTLGDGVEGLDPNRSTTIRSEVWAIEEVGGLMLVGGAFTHVRDRSTYERIGRPYLAAFDPDTGEYVPWFSTQTDGPVYDILDLGDGRAALIGEFSSVNSVPGTEGLAVIDVATGRVDTSVSVDLGGEGIMRAGALRGSQLHLTGSFTSVDTGQGRITASGLTRIDLGTGVADASWTPRLEGGGGWGIGIASGGRVFVGGYFSSVNGVEDTETLVALTRATGAVVNGWNHGFPHNRCTDGWSANCGAVNGLAVVGDTVFVAGAKHFWTALSTVDGTILADKVISNDGQSVDVVGDRIVIGCHCSSGGSEEFPGVLNRYHRVIDPVTLTEVESPTVDSRGGAGGWAAALATDGCLWAGGNLSSWVSPAEVNVPAWSLLRFCPQAGRGAGDTLPGPAGTDTTPPTEPGTPTTSQRGATIDLRWSASSDDGGQVGYVVFRNGLPVARTSGTSYSDVLLAERSTYVWQVAAFDPAGNLGSLSDVSAPVRIGRRVNVAPSGTVSSSTPVDGHGPELAIDGDTNGDIDGGSLFRGDLDPDPIDRPWWGIDLGSVVHVDELVMYPRTDASWAETNNRLRAYHNTSPISGASLPAMAGNRVYTGEKFNPDGPRIETYPIAEQMRYLRFFNNSARLSLAEVQVLTTLPAATPAAPAADTNDPTAPPWKAVRTRDGIAVLHWGPASDDTGVAYYEIWSGATRVATTTERSWAVGDAPQLSRDFTVVAVDAAGNRSLDLQTPVTVGVCGFTRDGAAIEVEFGEGADPTRWVIRRRVDGGTWFWRASVDGQQRAWTDADRPGVLEYQVSAVVGAAVTDTAECEDRTVGGAPAPEITRIEAALVVLKWPQADVEIERDGVVIATDDDGWYTDRTVVGGVTHSYRIRPVGGAEWSEAATATIPGGADPIAACAVVADGNQLLVTVDGAADADAIVVERSVDGGLWWWRGRIEDGSGRFVDSTREGALAYRTKLPGGDPVACSGP